MIHVYGLAYGVADYVRRSVASIIETAGLPISLTVIENPSCATPEIERDMRTFVQTGDVYRYVQLKENVRGSAYLDLTDRYLARDAGAVHEDHAFVVWTDLDLLVPHLTMGWAEQLRYVMEGGHVFGMGGGPSYRLRVPPDIAAFGLDLANYVPPNTGHVDVANRSGVWLMAIRRSFLAGLDRGKVTLDGELCSRAESGRGFMQIPHPRLYHLGWDLWRDAPWYWQEKVAGVPWDRYARPEIRKEWTHVHHGYKVRGVRR